MAADDLRETLEALASRWADVLRECKATDPRWILDRSVTTLETAHVDLRALLDAHPATPSERAPEAPFFRDKATGEPCVRKGNVLCHNTDWKNHRHVAIHTETTPSEPEATVVDRSRCDHDYAPCPFCEPAPSDLAALQEAIAREVYRRLHPGSINMHDSERTRETDAFEQDRAYRTWDEGREGYAPGRRCREIAAHVAEVIEAAGWRQVPDVGATLTEDERAALDGSLEDSGCTGFLGDHLPLYAAVERILAARKADE